MFQNPNDLALNMVAILPLALSFVFRRVLAAQARDRCGVRIPDGPDDRRVALAQRVARACGRHHRDGATDAEAQTRTGGRWRCSSPSSPCRCCPARTGTASPASRTTTRTRRPRAQARSTLMRESYRTFLDHPITGVGAGQFKNYKPEGRVEAWRESHNALLQVAAELGILGLGRLRLPSLARVLRADADAASAPAIAPRRGDAGQSGPCCRSSDRRGTRTADRPIPRQHLRHSRAGSSARCSPLWPITGPSTTCWRWRSHRANT